ncbi:acetyltransferase [Frankia sp. Mgl5]|uniref:acetyltransferase n=1 Tax=Frankia sp. Mgl5 TaxID=2933793 RepID=UPI00200EF22D|nr:acetyltransferase [Frankia sp. Mgl5]MCK9928788.1 acetyltransferase [Frankia sp. Mgl5]
MTPDGTTDQLDEWMIVELMGRVRRAGRVREVEIAGKGFFRLDVPNGDSWATQLIAPDAVYALTPTTEDIARAVAVHEQPQPVYRWELPAAPAPRTVEVDDQDDTDDESAL